jgi:hypothetical protein
MNTKHNLKNERSEKQFMFRVLTIMLTVLLCSISCFIISRFNYKYNDGLGIIASYIGGVIVTLITSVLFLIFPIILMSLPYFLLTEWLGVDKQESRIVSFYEDFGDLEAGNNIMMLFRVIFIMGYYCLFYVVIGPGIYGVIE